MAVHLGSCSQAQTVTEFRIRSFHIRRPKSQQQSQQLLSCNCTEEVPGSLMYIFALTAQELHMCWILLTWMGTLIFFTFLFYTVFYKYIYIYILLPYCCSTWCWIRGWESSVDALVHHSTDGRCCIRCSSVFSLVCDNWLSAAFLCLPVTKNNALASKSSGLDPKN